MRRVPGPPASVRRASVQVVDPPTRNCVMRTGGKGLGDIKCIQENGWSKLTIVIMDVL